MKNKNDFNRKNEYKRNYDFNRNRDSEYRKEYKEELKVSDLKDLKRFSEGQIIKLPDFAEGQEFIAKIRRPSMMALVKAGKIPNSLLVTANKLFSGKDAIPENDEKSLSKVFEVLDVICESCFVEPTYQELKENEVQLTDEQYMFIFNYTQNGVKALDSFREKSKNIRNLSASAKV